jgi:hypothetical protein
MNRVDPGLRLRAGDKGLLSIAFNVQRTTATITLLQERLPDVLYPIDPM